MVWTDLHARVHKNLRQRNLLPRDQRILIAVSGGQDSLCLGQLLIDLQSKWGWELAIAHCDHGWSTDAGIAPHVKQVAARWQLPFYLCQAEHPIAETEAAARQWRYQALTNLATQQRFYVLVTGHTQSDRAETFLYNLVRGAGMKGLGSLAEERALTADLKLIRPLLEVKRTETLSFCQQFSLPIYEDQFNQNLKFARNCLRHTILPTLKQINAQVETHLAHTAAILNCEDEYLEAIANNHLQQALSPHGYLDRISIRQHHLAIQRRIVLLFLKKILPRTPNYQQVSDVVNLITAPDHSQASTFPGSITIWVEQEWIKHS